MSHLNTLMTMRDAVFYGTRNPDSDDRLMALDAAIAAMEQNARVRAALNNLPDLTLYCPVCGAHELEHDEGLDDGESRIRIAAVLALLEEP